MERFLIDCTLQNQYQLATENENMWSSTSVLIIENFQLCNAGL